MIPRMMRVIAARAHIGDGEPSYAYRLYVPFTELSLERQALIPYRTPFGVEPGDQWVAGSKR
ncbi:MAG: hypothetical protein QHC67_15220 [Sphingobium sp.]|uniref:hypothetical protein n=1 Tax=Sphingobium sp. TaxID=1912891 RepID=UPI0029A2089E|nr:hypothetical protein [Sphingobium sp.]MDX3911149.1 hypothetical protein [Sphingobium sp.]